MIEPVGAYGVHQVESPFERQAVDFGPGKVSAGDQERFEALLGRTKEVAADGENMQVAQMNGGDFWIKQPAQALGPAAPPPPTIGDTILNGMQDFKDGWTHMMDTVGDMAKQVDFTPAELIRIQFQIQQTSISIGLVMNEMGSFDQEVSQLLRTS
jgi:hypothetical protein